MLGEGELVFQEGTQGAEGPFQVRSDRIEDSPKACG